jgi:hypothetical protein
VCVVCFCEVKQRLSAEYDIFYIWDSFVDLYIKHFSSLRTHQKQPQPQENKKNNNRKEKKEVEQLRFKPSFQQNQRRRQYE